jgi:hypothetical protein
MRQARRNGRRLIAASGFKSGLLKYTRIDPRIDHRTRIEHDGRAEPD